MKWSILVVCLFGWLQSTSQRIFTGEIVYQSVQGSEQATVKLFAGENHRRLDIFKGDTLHDYFLIRSRDTNFYHIDITDRVIVRMSQRGGPDFKPVSDPNLKDTTIHGFHCTPQKYSIAFPEDNGIAEMYIINWYATGFRFNNKYEGRMGPNPIEDSMIVLMQQMVVESPDFKTGHYVETTFLVQKITPGSPAESLFQLPSGYAVQDLSEYSDIIVTDVELVEVGQENEEEPPPPPPPPPQKKKKKD